MDSQLVVFRFESVAEADQVEASLRSLAAEGFLGIEDAARLTRDDDGTVTVQPRNLGELARGSTLGGVLGLLAGGLIGLPVVGMLAGAGLGAKHSLHADRLEYLLGTLGRDMASGSVVLAVLVTDVDDPDTVADRLSVHRESILSLEIPEELRAHIESQRAAGEPGGSGE